MTYPLLIEKTNGAREEVDGIIYWLAGSDREGLQEHRIKEFFQMNPNCDPVREWVMVAGWRKSKIIDVKNWLM